MKDGKIGPLKSAALSKNKVPETKTEKPKDILTVDIHFPEELVDIIDEYAYEYVSWRKIKRQEKQRQLSKSHL